MIEQIINWWNSLEPNIKPTVCVAILYLSFFIFVIYDSMIKPTLKNKRKTTTQKYREGLIKK